MRLVFENPKDSAANILRREGYNFLRKDDVTGEMSFVKRVGGGDYPRFHIYAKMDARGRIEVNLHLDQKKASYRGTAAHSGEYDGEILEREMENIKKAFNY